MIQQIVKPLQRLVRWFFWSPFQQLPPEFGETTPPELQAFAANAEEAQRHPRESVQPSNYSGSKQTGSDH